MQIIFYGLNKRPWNRIHSFEIQETIKEYIKNTKDGFIVKDFRQHIYEKHKILLTSTVIIKFMKNKLNLSFKKSWVRPYRWDWKKLSFARLLYSVRLSKLWDKNTLIVNIDETLISNSITNWMSWIPKGRNREQFIKKYEGSASLITAVTSEGNYLATPLIRTIDHSIFKEFLSSLEGWIASHNFKYNRNVVIILDNCSFHRNKEWQLLMKSSNYTYMYIPQYSPIVAPIELIFGKFKYLIKNDKLTGAIRWNSLEGIEQVGHFISKIQKEEIVAWFRHSLKISRMYLEDFRRRLTSLIND